jgi:HSP20 family protein
VEKADGSFCLHCDLPGCDPKDLDVTLDGDNLTIKAERAAVHTQDTDTYFQRERKFGQVTRTLRLPQNCDGEKADVKFANGVLQICFPKKAGTALKKKLAIKQ